MKNDKLTPILIKDVNIFDNLASHLDADYFNTIKPTFKM